MIEEIQQQETDRSPRRLARKIEGCVVRSALDEEQRAQKALYLLRARDDRIAFLEKRVIELENVAASIHQLSLRHSSGSMEQDQVSSDLVHSASSFKTDESLSNLGTGREMDGKSYEDCDSDSGNRTSVPCLDLSKSSTSDSERDVFSTPAFDFVSERKKHFATNLRSAKANTVRERNENNDEFAEKHANCKRQEKSRTVRDQSAIGGEKNALLDEKQFLKGAQATKNETFEGNLDNRVVASVSMGETSLFGVSRVKRRGSKLAKTSSSVPRIRAKRSFRKKLRSAETRMAKRLVEFVGDGGQRVDAFRRIENGSMDRQPGDPETVHGAKKQSSPRTEKGRPSEEHRELSSKQEETHLIAVDSERKAFFTQTTPPATQSKEVAMNAKHSSRSCVYLEQKKSPVFFHAEDDPAPQWLIEEALNRGVERSERRTKGDAATSRAIRHEAIILELKMKLSQAKKDLEEAAKLRSMTKEKYKRLLESVKMDARRENEVMQERIVRICTSVLENFCPRPISEKKRNYYQVKGCRRLKRHELTSNRFHKKLRTAVAKSNKLQKELTNAKEALKIKSEKCESISKCFDKLKLDMENAELDLNNLISENLSLRKKIEDPRDYYGEHSGGKSHREKNNLTHFRDAQRSREMTNLRKKIQEDFSAITQLRNKLLRSESANANKGFLLNSYKSQLADLNKEKSQFLTKINNLENDVHVVRASNSQLKAKISVLNNEKNKIVSDNEKSKTDLTEKMETQCAQKCEETLQQEKDAIKAKYEDAVKSIKSKITASENQNSEYSKAIKEFLRKLHSYQGTQEVQRNSNESEASEKEAHETACNILNMTPDELTGFINGKTPNSINSWIIEMNQIITKKNFSDSLSKFLLKKTMRKIRV